MTREPATSNRAIAVFRDAQARGARPPYLLAAADVVSVGFTLSAVLLVVCAFFAVAAPYSLDEAIYILMAEAASAGRLAIPNGYELYASELLKVLFLREGPSGLVPQYPSGYGFLALPFYVMAGPRGLIVMNALGYLAAMIATYGLARQLEASRHTALSAALMFGFGTFAVAYAVGIWPHSIAVAIVCGSALAIVAATRDESARKSFSLALVGGFLVGFGATIRVDVVLLVPPVLLWLLGQREHWTKAATYLVGLAPGLLLAAWLNFLKFGTWLPIDYGASGGSMSIAGYLPFFPAILLATATALVLSSYRMRAYCSPRNIVLCGAAALLAMLALEETRSLLIRIAMGFYVLVIDFQAYRPQSWEAALFSRSNGGHLLVIGVLKRALLQSLPALGVLPLLILILREERQPVPARCMLFLLIIGFWVLPFALQQLHGGSPQNMRYFLPILPFLSILMAIAFTRLLREASFCGKGGPISLFVASLFASGVVVLLYIGVHQRDSLALTIATKGALILAAATAMAVLIFLATHGSFKRAAARVGLALGAIALAWGGMSNLVHDVAVSQLLRTINAQGNEHANRLDDRVLIVTRKAYQFLPQLLRPNSFVALARGGSLDADERGLIDYHLAHGRRVYVDGEVAEGVLAALGAPAFNVSKVAFGRHGLVELRARSPRPDAGEAGQ